LYTLATMAEDRRRSRLGAAGAESESFGALLYRYRVAAGLSQDELAERAGLSARGISDLERGARLHPHPATARRLAVALELERADRDRLLRARASEWSGPSASELDRSPPLEPTPLQRADLPRELNAFVGREHDLEEVTRRLDGAGLVTIAGPGGAGKTRLAVRLAHHLSDTRAPADGVVLVELAPLTNPRHVVQTLAESLGLPEPSGHALIDVLVRALRPKHLLLVLDNCEHLVEACAEVADRLVRSCPYLRLLATSREPLNVAGEVVYRIPPLRLPIDDSLESLADSESGRLFVQRARAANALFALAPTNARPVAEICRRLDGLPLAIELAAARVAAFAPADIARRLDDAIRLAADGPRSAPIRQQTLEAAIAWSVTLLDDQERCLFGRLAVFAGGFTLPGSQAVASGDLDALEVLPRLVAKSMVQAEPQPDGAVRYRLLEPLRQFARARLVETGDLDTARRLQARHVLAWAEAVMREAATAGLFEAAPHFNLEADNIRVALEWAFEMHDAEFAARLGAALWMWWSRPDRQAQGRAWVERILAMPNAALDQRLRERLVVGLAFLCLVQGDMAAGARLAEEVRLTAQAMSDATVMAVASSVLGAAMVYRGEVDVAEPVIRESFEFARAAGQGWIEMLDLGTLGQMAMYRGDHVRAEELGLRDEYPGPRRSQQ
jgi:predicted ATPase/DNA-binding XRE family transcriptional regulator